tara:strand:+ start:696 stop:1367 length:672 start_codon:yes stop_codon:yes gene_type:complete
MEGTNTNTQELKTPNAPKKIGDTYKITGGKYKKFGTAILKKNNATYSDCELSQEKCDEYSQLSNIVKIKNAYLLAENPFVVEMPEAKDLEIVENLEDFEKAKITIEEDDYGKGFEGKSQKVNEVLKELLTGDDPDGQLEVDLDAHDPIVDNITDELPSIDEALKLRNEVKGLRDQVVQLTQQLMQKEEQVKLEMEKCLLERKKMDYVRNVFGSVMSSIQTGLS